MASFGEIVARRWQRLLVILDDDDRIRAVADRAYSFLREVLAVALALFLLRWLYWYSPVALVPPTLFWVLMVIPGGVGLLYHFVSVSPRFKARQASVDRYQQFVREHDSGWRDEWDQRIRKAFGTVGSAKAQPTQRQIPNALAAFDNISTYSPSAGAALWAAIILTGVFSVAAMVADSQTTGRSKASPLSSSTLLTGFPLLVGQVEVVSPTTDTNDPKAISTVGTSTPPAEPAALAAPPPTANDLAKWRISITANALNGLLFAALGAYISVLWRMMMRINANALTYRFMFTAALRSAIALIIGLAAGQLDLFGFVKANGPREAIFFLAGLFTDWAIGMLRARARDVFQRGDAGCDRLPLCLVDGLDDGVIDILDEIGIWDVQHLATAEPGELTMRTLLPFNRVLDWVDQAILISCIRDKIRIARDLGIRGAIDFMSLYSYTRKTPGADPTTDLGTRAEALLKSFADKSGMGEDAVQILAGGFWFDYTVNLLYSLWQRIGPNAERAGSGVP